MERNDEKRYVSVKKFAEMFDLSYHSVIRNCEKGKIPGAVKVGGVWRIDPNSLNKKKMKEGE